MAGYWQIKKYFFLLWILLILFENINNNKNSDIKVSYVASPLSFSPYLNRWFIFTESANWADSICRLRPLDAVLSIAVGYVERGGGLTSRDRLNSSGNYLLLDKFGCFHETSILLGFWGIIFSSYFTKRFLLFPDYTLPSPHTWAPRALNYFLEILKSLAF